MAAAEHLRKRPGGWASDDEYLLFGNFFYIYIYEFPYMYIYMNFPYIYELGLACSCQMAELQQGWELTWRCKYFQLIQKKKKKRLKVLISGKQLLQRVE